MFDFVLRASQLSVCLSVCPPVCYSKRRPTNAQVCVSFGANNSSRADTSVSSGVTVRFSSEAREEIRKEKKKKKATREEEEEERDLGFGGSRGTGPPLTSGNLHLVSSLGCVSFAAAAAARPTNDPFVTHQRIVRSSLSSLSSSSPSSHPTI